MGRDAAAQLAWELLMWLAADPPALARFLDATGLGPADLRARPDDPGLALAVLEHLLEDEPRLLSACRALGLPPEAPRRAAAALGAGPVPHWT